MYPDRIFLRAFAGQYRACHVRPVCGGICGLPVHGAGGDPEGFSDTDTADKIERRASLAGDGHGAREGGGLSVSDVFYV